MKISFDALDQCKRTHWEGRPDHYNELEIETFVDNTTSGALGFFDIKFGRNEEIFNIPDDLDLDLACKAVSVYINLNRTIMPIAHTTDGKKITELDNTSLVDQESKEVLLMAIKYIHYICIDNDFAWNDDSVFDYSGTYVGELLNAIRDFKTSIVA